MSDVKFKIQNASMVQTAPEINVFKPLTFLSTPAAIAMVSYLVLAVIILLPFEIPVQDEQTGQVVVYKYHFVERLLVVLILTLPVVLSIYSINCMVVGNCELLSYFIAFLTVIWIAIFVVISFMYTFSK